MLLQSYEIGITLLFFAILAWVIRSRDPINLGALIGGFMLFGFDWLWCSKGFWNATTASDLVMIPGLDILGVRYPISICFIWAVGFGFLPAIASRFHAAIGSKLGGFHLPAIFAAAATIDFVVEVVCISYFGVWTYHQAPEYKLLGYVWSNLWFLGGVLTASYFGLAYVRRWAAIPERSGLSLASEATWRGLLMAIAAVIVPAFFLGVAQLFWWSATQPWVESGRPF